MSPKIMSTLRGKLDNLMEFRLLMEVSWGKVVYIPNEAGYKIKMNHNLYHLSLHHLAVFEMKMRCRVA